MRAEREFSLLVAGDDATEGGKGVRDGGKGGRASQWVSQAMQQTRKGVRMQHKIISAVGSGKDDVVSG